MTTNLDHALSLDPSLLAGPVRRATGKPDVAILTWRIEPVSGSASFLTEGLYRVHGTGRSGGCDLPWGDPQDPAVDNRPYRFFRHTVLAA